MVDILKDLKIRDILIKSESGYNGVLKLGERIYEFLEKISTQNLIRGCYFSHYFHPDPNNELCHVRVGIRFDDTNVLSIINDSLNQICQEESKIISEYGRFQDVKGEHSGLLVNIVVDYIICYSFQWLMSIKKNYKSSPPSLITLAEFIIQNKIRIEEDLMSKNIFRKNILRQIDVNTRIIIWERFIHHLCNALKIPMPQEKVLWIIIALKGIDKR